MQSIKITKSLCPECLKVIDAEIYEDGGKVYIRKSCQIHGDFEDVYWGDYFIFEKANAYEYIGDGIKNPRTSIDRGCPYDCGICPSHKSHTVLAIIDVTNRCNLRCPICFANAAAAGYIYEPTQEEIFEMLKNLRRNQPVAPNSIQFSGGEPTVREDLPELIAMAKELGFHHIEVNTNGIRISKDPDYLKKLLDAGLSTLYLQFDGLTSEPYLIARGLDLLNIKLKVIENARKVGLDSIVLVPTIVRGVNDNQVGDIIRFAARNSDVIRGVNFQPVSITGRIDREKLRDMRITIPDVLKLIEEQTNGEIRVEDFYPIPVVIPISKAVGALKGRRFQEFTNHQHCGMATIIMPEGDKLIPITRYANVEKFMDSMKKVYNAASNGSSLKARIHLLGALRYIKLSLMKELLSSVLTQGDYGSLGKFMRKVILIGCMHFMDPYNFDLERVQRCTIHYAMPEGKIIPFCTMNSIHRPILERKYSKTS
ncbi:MAG: radical SAM protein [Candidatus Methanomethyliaceae archaeon]|nr:radical SAM protein [Candidatus Methanomethyliaceae archaeon]MDW7971246.1 radical SAM protein [Nitrososphaerota archaeon]